MRNSSQIPTGLADFFESLEGILTQMDRCVRSENVHPAIQSAFDQLKNKVTNLDFKIHDERVAKIDLSSARRFIKPVNIMPDVIILSVPEPGDWVQNEKQLYNLIELKYGGLVMIEDEDFHIREFPSKGQNSLHLFAHDKLPDETRELRESILFDENKLRIVILGWLQQSKNIADSLQSFLNEKEKAVSAELFLNEKYRINKNTSELRKMSRKMGIIKSGIARQIKSITQEALDKLQKEVSSQDSIIHQVYRQFEVYDGFNSEDIVRNTQIDVPEGFIDRSTDLIKASLSETLTNSYSWLKNLESGIKESVELALKNLSIESEIEVEIPLDQRNIEWIVNDNVNPEGDWTRSFTRKGLYHLFMELRTPMFMLLPFMMIGSLFAALLIGVDEGSINASITHSDEREEIIVISKLPSKYFPDDPDRQGHLSFMEDVNKRIKDGVFDRNSVTLLQHETKIDRYNKKVKIAKFLFDPSTHSLTLFPVSNRMEVIEMLKDPTFKLLHQGGGNIRMGYSALFGLMAKISDYKYLVFGGLMLLILWYGRKKFNDYKKEKVETAEREKRSLRHALRTSFEKSVHNAVHAWQSNVSDSFRSYQELLVQNVQRAIDDKVEEETLLAQEEKLLSDTRNKIFSQKEKEIHRILKDTNQLSREIERAIIAGERMQSRVKRSIS